MTRPFLFFILSIFAFRLFAQQPVISVASGFIASQQFDSANLYLDSILKKDKKNVDALMMKGNVILNRDILALPTPQIFTVNDESIFEGEFTPPLDSRKIVGAKTVSDVERFWQQCLTIDSSRVDIYKGLCTLYAMALAKDKLKAAMAQLAKAEINDGEQPYRMAEYARKFKERGRFDEAMDVYRHIAGMYPKLAGLRCDMASEYFYEGRMNDALLWLDSAFNFKVVDETSFLNGAFIYSELGYFDNAQDVLNSYSKIYERSMDRFYFGLRQFADSSDGYVEALKGFMASIDSNTYYTEYKLAQQLLTFKSGFTLNDYRLFSASNFPDYYNVLVHQRALRQFAQRCEPSLVYGIFQNSIKNYPASVQFLEDGGNCKMSADQTESWMLNYGFALYMTGKKELALPYFKPILSSTNGFTSTAANYFTARILLQQNKKDDAKTHLQRIVDSKVETKYVALANHLLQTIK